MSYSLDRRIQRVNMDIYETWIVFIFLFLHCYSVFGQQEAIFQQKECDKIIINHFLKTVSVSSLGECAIICQINNDCAAVSYNTDQSSSNGMNSCSLTSKATPTEPYLFSYMKDTCIMLRIDMPEQSASIITNNQPTQEVSTDPTVTTSPTTDSATNGPELSLNESFIIGAVETVTNLCYLYSHADVVLLTRNGVYIYDDWEHLYSSPGPCKPVQTFDSVFYAFQDLPDITEVEAIMSHSTAHVEIYAKNNVWSFDIRGTQQYADPGFPKTYENHLKTATAQSWIATFPGKPLWGMSRAKYGPERYFYENETLYYYGNALPYYHAINDLDEPVFNANNVNINPWTSLPDNVVDIMLIPAQFNNYVIFTSNMSIFKYKLDYTVNSNNPSVDVKYMGTLLF